MRAAKAVGWQTVLVGRHARDSGEFIECEHADHAVDTVHELEKIMPHLFVTAAPAGRPSERVRFIGGSVACIYVCVTET